MTENYIAKNDKQLYQLDASEVQILPNAKPFDIVTSSEDTMVISRDKKDDPPHRSLYWRDNNGEPTDNK